ncbi:hypothetical protein [Solimicrobium silvestre]|uniref:Uncharacterized protein n=1 Tax=Solimicrobium silvestre TaxID=2099400 RepID=A0A2S9GSD5_9BURK|nr:hypothetical protein [Solimicrobium silvestre]PRC90620.1 hypothetical protein S2091_4671 [Solimicrobium silvestre]
MQSSNQLKTKRHVTTIAGLIMVGALSACGGGSGGGNDGKHIDSAKPIVPPVAPPISAATEFSRIGLDYQVGSNDYSRGDWATSIDASANITFSSTNKDSPALNYSFRFPSGLPGGAISGGLFSTTIGSANKTIQILTPSSTKTVQNVFWRNTNDPSVYGFGQAGYMVNPSKITWPTNGTSTYSGKAFQYIVSDGSIPSFAMYTNKITATVDYSAKTISIAVAPNPTLLNTIGNPLIINEAAIQNATNITMSNLNLSGSTIDLDPDPATGNWSQQHSNLGVGVASIDLAFFGNTAQELAGTLTFHNNQGMDYHIWRHQHISFALAKQP